MHETTFRRRVLLPLVCLCLAAGGAATPPPAAAQASTFLTVLVDGDAGEWQGVAPVLVDPSGDQGAAPVDLGAIYVANDDRFVYLRFEIGALLNLPKLPAPLRLHFDTDASASTGYPIQGIGSDLMIECSGGGGFGVTIYEQTAASFYATELGHAPFDAYQGPTVAATEYELRLARDPLLPAHGTPAFPGPEFRLALVALDGTGQPADTAPDAPGTLAYQLASGTPEPPPDNDLARLDPEQVRFLSYNVHQGDLFGPDAARFTRILQAIQPDVIGFQELWDYTASQVADRLDQDLPLGGGAHWRAAHGNRGQVTASRYPLAVDGGAPWSELGTTIDLPDATYGDRDVYLIDSHFKCCGAIGTSEDSQRQDAADAIVAWERELRTPGGPELPDSTPIVQLGDLNLVGGPQPLVTLLTGDIVDEGTYGPDSPPDWDGSDAARAAPEHTDGVAAYTWRNDFSAFMPGKLDYVIWTDSVAEAGNVFVLNTLDMAPEKLAALGLLADDTREASDHLPVVADLDVLAAPGAVGGGGGAPPLAGLRLRAAPNPLAQATRLDFDLPAGERFELDIFDGGGRLVRALAGTARGGGSGGSGGTRSLVWDGRDAAGRRVAQGIYFARLETAAATAHRATVKLTVVR